jgi:protein-disulfide isomerase
VAQSKRRPRQSSPSGSKLRSFYIILALVGLAGVGWIAYALIGAGESAGATQLVELTGLDDPQALYQAARGVVAGEAAAPVQVLVFSDFTCPACKTWSTAVEPQIKNEFVSAGRVRLVYQDFPLGPGPGHVHGFIAARAARCAEEQGKFWELHDVFFARQSEWTFASSAPIDQFVEYARLVGVDAEPFEACVRSDRHADVVTANRRLGETLGVNGTPTVYVGSRPVTEWSSYAAVREAILRELGS